MSVKTQVEIPVIDFAPFRVGGAEGKQQVAEQIYQACHHVGFLYLKNHGIPAAEIEAMFQHSRQFFDLPLAQKQAIAWSTEFSNRGYVGIERERLDETQPGDLKEAFNVGREIPVDQAVDSPALVQNRWPEGQDQFRVTVNRFFDRCGETAMQVFRAFALALSMPEMVIADQHRSQGFTLRLLHYPPLQGSPKPGQIRAGAHSDYGTLTLLFQDDVGGLEVQDAQGGWIPAPSIPGAVLINTGDLTQRWSNDVFRSTQHRVALPQREKTTQDRYSIAFFCQPDADAEITCFPSCQDESHPPRYAPITAGEYLLSRLQATY